MPPSRATTDEGGARPDDAAATLDEGPEEGRARFPGLRIDRRLGAGGSAVVFRAWSEARRGWVALKVLKAGRWASEAQRLRFRREVEVHRRLDDPGVVPIFDDGTTPPGSRWRWSTARRSSSSSTAEGYPRCARGWAGSSSSRVRSRACTRAACTTAT